MDRSQMRRRTFMKGTTAAVGASVLSGVTAGHGNKAEETSGKEYDNFRTDEPVVVGHRGFAGQYPENTVDAAVGAALSGADAIEIDVVPCADGTVVVFHDNRLSARDTGGLTDKDGLVWETDCETVLDAEVLESGQTVPTFEDFMDAIPPSLGVNIELKNPGSLDLQYGTNLQEASLSQQKDLWRPFTERVLTTAADYENTILVSSFYEAALATTREFDQDIPIAFLFWDSIETGLEITQEYDCEALHPPYDMISGTPFFNSGAYIDDPDYDEIDLVERAHDEGREVNVYTLTTWNQAEQLADANVDGIIADHPGLLAAGD
jgi:glycerophosphoryl diester phosphodiesterase